MLAACSTSLRFLGVDVSLHAAYSAEAMSAEMDLPLTRPFSNAFLYMYAAFSITASDIASLSLSLFSSENACRKLRSTGSCTWLLLSHVLSLSMVDFIDVVRGLPDASLFIGFIMVASPMSCIVSEVGAPALARSPRSSWVNERHSGPYSWSFSDRTKPQLEQNVSPDSVSVTIFPLAHLGHCSL
ncbi:hypothetical protein GBAR_LOCUS27870, partial [Geodia barretti]